MKKILTIALIAISALLFSCTKDKKESIKILLAEANVTMNVGETKTLNVKVTPEGDYSNRMVWNSSNTAAVTVQNGTLTALAKGESIITVSIDNEKAMCRVIVSAIPVEKIILNKEEIQIEVDSLFQLEAKIEPENATDAKVTYESENPDFATVSETGVVKGITAGTTKIIAKAGEKSAECKVVITPAKMKIKIDVTDITAGGAKIKFTPSMDGVKYYIYGMTKKKYDEECKKSEEAGNDNGIISFDIAYAKMMANMYGSTWQEEFYTYQQEDGGVIEKLMKDFDRIVTYDTEYVVYAYALDKSGTLISEFAKVDFKTEPMVPSNNEITVNILEEHTNGVTAEFIPSNPEDSYFISLQPYEGFIDWYEKNPQYTDIDMAVNIMKSVLDVLPAIPVHKGKITIDPTMNGMSVKNSGAKYYIIYFSYDAENGIRSKISKKEFYTK
jgi:Bacterial surface proteins containing Ig-like domains